MSDYVSGKSQLRQTHHQHQTPSHTVRHHPHCPLRHQDQEIQEVPDDESEELYEGTGADAANTLRQFVDLTDVVEEEEDEYEDNSNARVLSIPQTLPPPLFSKTSICEVTARRNGRPIPPWSEIPHVAFENSTLSPGNSVQLATNNENKFNTRLFLITQILRNERTGRVKLSGHMMFRSTKCLGMLPNKLNELHLTVDEDLDDDRPFYEQGMVQVDLEEVVKTRAVTFTHTDFPLLSFRTAEFIDREMMSKDKYRTRRDWIRDQAGLVCRYVMIRKYATASDRMQKYPKVAETELRRLYNGETPLITPSFLKQVLESSSKSTGTVQQKRPKMSRLGKISSLTYSSGFCGLGGDSEGARRAGSKVVSAFDHDKKSCITFELNHPDAIVFNRSADWMCNASEGLLPKADIVHLSCPCQMWSPAKTHAGPNDEANEAALFTPLPYLKKTKPRYHTQEQTAGLISRHPVFFGALVNQIISAGYNVRWTRVNFRDYGLASSRDRLIIFAAEIGAPIPKFPAKTHGIAPNLLPYKSIQDVISDIPEETSWHLDTVNGYAHARPAYNGHSFAPCITTGSNLSHPDGTRPLSIREIAAINGFPTTFKFPPRSDVSATDLRRQVGNAVPPLVWEKFVAQIIACNRDFQEGKIDESGNAAIQSPSRRRPAPFPSSGNNPRTLSMRSSPSLSRQGSMSQRSVSRTLSPAPGAGYEHPQPFSTASSLADRAGAQVSPKRAHDTMAGSSNNFPIDLTGGSKRRKKEIIVID